MNRKIVSEILGISEKSYYRWKEERKIFKLLEMYFSDNDLKEFLETNKISKFDNFNNYYNKNIEKIDKYLEFFKDNIIDDFEYETIKTYFNTLIKYKDKNLFVTNFMANLDNTSPLYSRDSEIERINNMVKENIFNLIDEIQDLLNNSEMMILVERAINNEKSNGITEIIKYNSILREALYQCTLYNIYKYKNDLNVTEKENLTRKILKEVIPEIYQEKSYKMENLYNFNFEKFRNLIEKLKQV